MSSTASRGLSMHKHVDTIRRSGKTRTSFISFVGAPHGQPTPSARSRVAKAWSGMQSGKSGELSAAFAGDDADRSGLHNAVLSPVETLAQSLSTIAPSTTPALTVPLVFALAGIRPWLCHGISMVAMLLIALCIRVFARDSSSPGSLYSYVRGTLPPIFGAATAFALLFAYVCTAASVIGGFVNFSYVLLGRRGASIPASLLELAVAACAVWVACYDVKVSAQLMLWIEAASVLLMTVVVAAVLHLHAPQTHLSGSSYVGVRQGVMLALFSFVGFESATTLGAEARNPLRTIPRAVVQSAIIAGVFFVVCCYSEVLGFAQLHLDLAASDAPFRTLSTSVGLRPFGVVIDVGVLISAFACTLACVTGAARLLLRMGQLGLVSQRFTRTHASHGTPVPAGVLAGVAAVLPPVVLSLRHASPTQIYGWLGTLSVFGFLTTYALVALALPVYLHRRGRMGAGNTVLAAVSLLLMLMAILGTVYPAPPSPDRWFPYLYLLYMAVGLGWFAQQRSRQRTPHSPRSQV